MSTRAILVPTWAEADGIRPLDTALVVAQQLGAHIRCLFVRSDPRLALTNYMPELAATGIDFERLEHETNALAAHARGVFEDWRVKRGVASARADYPDEAASASWAETVGDIAEVVTHFGRLNDLIITPQAAADTSMCGRAFDAALFGTGRLTMVVADNAPADLFAHVMVAWNGSVEATRAVMQSLDILRAAKRVSIVGEPQAPSTPAELGDYLRGHGIQAETNLTPVAEGAAGPMILAHAADAGATLLVRGAYTHGRFRQALMGGITQHVLTHANIPVLVAH